MELQQHLGGAEEPSIDAYPSSSRRITSAAGDGVLREDKNGLRGGRREGAEDDGWKVSAGVGLSESEWEQEDCEGSFTGVKEGRGGQIETEAWREAGRIDALRIIESAQLQVSSRSQGICSCMKKVTQHVLMA